MNTYQAWKAKLEGSLSFDIHDCKKPAWLCLWGCPLPAHSLKKTYKLWFRWCDWWENWGTREHLVACNYQNPLFPCAVERWIFWVRWFQLFSFEWQSNKTSLPGTIAKSLFLFCFWLCTPALFLGRACKNTGLVAPNSNSMCCQTEIRKINKE